MAPNMNFRKLIAGVVYVCIIWASMTLAFMIRFDWELTPRLIEACVYFAVWASFVRIILFSIFGAYQWSFRYASISEATNIFKAVTISTLLLVVVAFFSRSAKIGRSVLLIDYLLFLFLVTSSRFLPRVLIKFRQACHTNLKKVLIVGAGSAGEMVARELTTAKDRLYEPVGFIDDNPGSRHSRIHGIKVLGVTNDITSVVKKYNVEEIIIAVPSASGKTIRDIISKCEKTDVKIKTIPGLHKILTGEVTIKQIRDVEPEDLMGRKTVEINTEDIYSLIKGKTVLVTGAGGSIGSELCRQIARFRPGMLLFFDHNENDIYFLA